MNHIFPLNLSIPFQSNNKKRDIYISHILKGKEINISKTLIFSTFFLITALFLASIIEVSLFAKEVHLIKNYEIKIRELSKENENLEIDFSKLNSLSNIENYISSGKFVKVTKTKYIPVLESTVARLNK